jgi:NADH-quinone oxidoreductase subunit L
MLIPVAILAALAVVGGFIQTRALGFGPSVVSDFLERVVAKQSWEETGAAVAVGLLTMLLATGLFAAAYRLKPWSAVVPWAQRLLERKYYFDEIYNAVFVRPLDAVAAAGYRTVETEVLDGAVVGTGRLAASSASYGSFTQTGYFRNYVLVFVASAVIIGVLLIVRLS